MIRPSVILLAGLASLSLVLPSESDEAARATALAGIVEADIVAHLRVFAAPELEGRDSPSVGLEAAARYIEAQFEQLGIVPIGRDDYRHAFSKRLSVPAEKDCRLVISEGGDAPETKVLGTDYVPLPRCVGKASGPAVFAGFGIASKKPRWNSFQRVKLEGAIAVVFEGEPRHRKLFDGDEITPSSDAYGKVKELASRGAVGVVIVRRPPADDDPETGPAAPELGYRYTWASWLHVTDPRGPRPSARIPVVEVGPALGSALLGVDSEELAARGDASGRPLRHELRPLTIELSTGFDPREVRVDNVVGVYPGSDPALASEYVVVGAHYDHIGVDSRGRVGNGADDNGSGSAALLEIAQAVVSSHPARSVLFCAFAAEEDGLVGSKALAQNPPVPRDSMVAMINLDMIGRGKDSLVVALGVEQNPALGKVLERARKLGDSGIREVVTDKAAHLWERSDHHSFHAIGVPVLFFFEAEHESENPDYHTFRDTLDLVSLPKVVNTARLAYNTVWILATDAERPPAPRN